MPIVITYMELSSFFSGIMLICSAIVTLTVLIVTFKLINGDYDKDFEQLARSEEIKCPNTNPE